MANAITTEKIQVGKHMKWRVNTPGLFKEIVESNDGLAIFRIPLSVVQGILAEVADYAIAKNDPELHKLMLRLSLYEVANPESPEFDMAAVTKYLSE